MPITHEEFAEILARNPQLRISRQNRPVSRQTPDGGMAKQAPETPATPLAGVNGGVKKRKYRNEPTVVDGIRFDSRKEARRYQELLLLERGGKIKALALQPSFDLWANNQHICRYRGDFSYIENGKTVVEDCKGIRTAVYKLKKKLMRVILGIEILET